jgi:hypothetical protein
MINRYIAIAEQAERDTEAAMAATAERLQRLGAADIDRRELSKRVAEEVKALPNDERAQQFAAARIDLAGIAERAAAADAETLARVHETVLRETTKIDKQYREVKAAFEQVMLSADRIRTGGELTEERAAAVKAKKEEGRVIAAEKKRLLNGAVFKETVVASAPADEQQLLLDRYAVQRLIDVRRDALLDEGFAEFEADESELLGETDA